MEMKSVAVDRASLRDETTKFKVARKSTSVMKKKESEKHQVSDDDPLCGIEIYEVVGGGAEERDVDPQVKSEKCKKSEDREETVVGGGEGLPRRQNQMETPEKSKGDGLTDVKHVNANQKDKSEKGLGSRGNNPQGCVASATSKVQKSTAAQNPDKSAKIDNARIAVTAQSDNDSMRDCELVLTHANGETLANVNSSVKTMDDISSKGKERPMDKGKSVRETGGKGTAGKNVEVVDSRRSDSSGVCVAQEDLEQDGTNEDGQVSTSKVGQEGIVESCTGVEEIVVSSGSAWDTEIQMGTEFYGCVDNYEDDDDDDEIGQLKIDESDSLEFIKRYVGETFDEDGINVDTGEGKTAEKEGRDRKANKGEETGSVARENGIEENGKRKRTTPGEGAGESLPKKRRIGRWRKSGVSDDVSDGEKGNKGKCNTEESIKMDPAKSDSDGCDNLEETIDRAASGHLALPFLESLRGSIKTLSRADLEELIVQKLCEVITERSTVGLLRKKAELLERNQERWKEKVSALTKQMKEMDMVMKKYLSEVRKLQTEKNFQVVAPLRVTRSVGLQVSFTSAASKVAKVVPAVQLAPVRDDKAIKKQLQRTVYIPQNPKKSMSLVPTTPVKKSLVIDQKKFTPKSAVSLAYQTRAVNEAQLAAKPAVHLQQSRRSKLPAVLPADGSSSSLIDLTSDDERHTQEKSLSVASRQSVTVRPTGQVRVVNHVQMAQGSAGKVAFLLPSPTTSASGSGSGSSTSSQCQRQLSIPTTSAQSAQKHILPSAPPLLYKGSTVAQSGSQQQGVASQNRVSPKLMHPAPLPSTPLNQSCDPDWKQLPPRPALKISKVQTGIVLSWNMVVGEECAQIASYQLFAYQESSVPPATTLWKRVGEVNALPLPMACTLTQFMSGFKYYFAVRAVDVHSRVGPFSCPISIFLAN